MKHYLFLLKVRVLLYRLKFFMCDGFREKLSKIIAFAYVLLVLAFVFLTSCTTFEKCQAKYGTGVDSVKVLVPVVHRLPGTGSALGFSQDLLEAMPVGSSVTSQPEGATRTKATLYKNSEKDFECKAETETIVLRDTVLAQCPPVANFRPEPVVITKTPGWNKFLIWLLGVALAVQTVRLWLRRKTEITINTPSVPTQQDNGLPS